MCFEVEVLSLGFFHNLLIVACIAILTPCLFLDLLQISNTKFFSPNLCLFLVNYVPLMVDHVTRVAIIGVCDQPINTCTSLGKSTSTTFNASTFGMFNASNLRLVGVEVLNVPIITTSLKVPKKN